MNFATVSQFVSGFVSCYGVLYIQAYYSLYSTMLIPLMNVNQLTDGNETGSNATGRLLSCAFIAASLSIAI